MKFTEPQIETLVIAFIYMEQLNLNTRVTVDRFSVHRLLLTALLIAQKMYQDTFYNNGYFARIGGGMLSNESRFFTIISILVTRKELNKLEEEMLFLLDFKMLISPDVYKSYVEQLANLFKISPEPMLYPPCMYQFYWIHISRVWLTYLLW